MLKFLVKVFFSYLFFPHPFKVPASYLVWTYPMYGPVIMKLLSEHFFLKLCQKDNLLSGEVETLSCYWYGPIIMKLLSEQFF